MNQSCLVTAFENAKVLAPIEERSKNTNSRTKKALDDDGNEIPFLTETELNLLKSSIHSRDVLNVDLEKIAELFNIGIEFRYIKFDSNNPRHIIKNGPIIQYHPSTETSIIGSGSRIIRLICLKFDEIFSHYMLDDVISKSDVVRLGISTQGLNISTFILKVLNETKYFEPMDDDIVNQLDYSFKHEINPFQFSRPIKVPRKNHNPHIPTKYGQRMFGFHPEPDDIGVLIGGLQFVIDTILKEKSFNVKAYSKFSSIMMRLAYEYGCFDGVQESTGEKNKQVRDSIRFPKQKLNSQPHLKGKYYYIDLNGAFSSCVTGIPYDLEPNSEMNPKIVELLQCLYKARTYFKNKSSPIQKLAKTIKFMMCSIYGISITRDRKMKYKFAKDRDKFGDRIVKYDPNTKFAQIIEPFKPNFNFPQYAKSLLDNYHALMDKISSLVKVLYYNVDSILISEDDYNKLQLDGYIGDNLGQFRLEYIFAEVKFESSVKWIGRTIDGKIIRKRIKDSVSFEDFNIVSEL